MSDDVVAESPAGAPDQVMVQLSVPGLQGMALRVSAAVFNPETDRYESVGTLVLDHTQGTIMHIREGQIVQLALAPRSAASDPAKDPSDFIVDPSGRAVAANDDGPRIVL